MFTKLGLSLRAARSKWISVTCALFGLMFVLTTLYISPVDKYTQNLDRASSSSPSTSTTASANEPMRACFVVLVRNSELQGIKNTVMQIEARFNKRFQYPYVFLNDDYFTDQFVQEISSLTTAQVNFGKVDQQMWGYPSYINQTHAALQRADLAAKGIPYADSESYRHMCRFQSGFFFRHPLLDPYDYYWRIEPDVDYHCDIDYDVFRYMKENGKKYGFNIAFREYMATVPSLWQTVLDFKKNHPEVVKQLPQVKDSLWNFVAGDNGEAYNSCHFWTNFEIASLDLWRSNEYLKFFNYLDRSGGFFYERWGDAPVHSIAAAMMLKKDKFHFFNDIGYRHTAYTHCPTEEVFRSKCSCNPDDNFDYNPGLSCYTTFKNALSS
ncbi:nucleotide-diphospho-sugar transferase [Absidia repens]|uniref:Nucleotide-diphospho-sugar transferase n=1 Tax=Absidia repens TaxID=90262 RepID=A0A1X2ICP4_9FUNG|nr:nucleotide-diphospho-sugar transferase [Absidia repens]